MKQKRRCRVIGIFHDRIAREAVADRHLDMTPAACQAKRNTPMPVEQILSNARTGHR
jgi:hypothetical protein